MIRAATFSYIKVIHAKTTTTTTVGDTNDVMSGEGGAGGQLHACGARPFLFGAVGYPEAAAFDWTKSVCNQLRE